jgi:hypothetical protein
MRTIMAAIALTAALCGHTIAAENGPAAQAQQVSEQANSDLYRGYSTAQLFGPGEW